MKDIHQTVKEKGGENTDTPTPFPIHKSSKSCHPPATSTVLGMSGVQCGPPSINVLGKKDKQNMPLSAMPSLHVLGAIPKNISILISQ